MTIQQTIQSLATTYQSQCIAIRRHLHTHPELSFHEHQTAAYIQAQLLNAGLPAPTVIGDTGVTVDIVGGHPGKTILLRADIDALPIQEIDGRAYGSTHPGVMHACGHDAHTAMMLSATRILHQLRADMKGTIRIIFQPAEETLPGGAQKMIREGILKTKVPVSAAIGQHVMPRIPVGKVGIRAGRFMASVDNFYMTVKGRGGHAAMPETVIDPVLVAGHIIVAVQQLVSRHTNPRIPAVCSIGKVIAMGSHNVIPNEATLEGTFRTTDETIRKDALQKIERLVTALATSMGATVDIQFEMGYPYLHNDEALSSRLKKYIQQYVGPENVIDEDIWMAAEDFAYYTHHVPATFYLLGVRNETRGITAGLHTPDFDIDEASLPLGAGLMAWLAWQELNGE